MSTYGEYVNRARWAERETDDEGPFRAAELKAIDARRDAQWEAVEAHRAREEADGRDTVSRLLPAVNGLLLAAARCGRRGADAVSVMLLFQAALDFARARDAEERAQAAAEDREAES